MATTVAEIDDIVDDDWVVGAENVSAAIVQVKGKETIIVAVATSKPDVGSEVGISLSSEDITTLPIMGLESGTDIVYLKGKTGKARAMVMRTT